MAMNGVTRCAVPHCIAPLSEPNNLCEAHRVPGAVVRHGESTMVITTWYAEHAGEHGVIIINDFALGDLFGGRRGFQAKLRDQGFFNVRLLRTPAELEAAKLPKSRKKVGDWSGPWNTRYAWENGEE